MSMVLNFTEASIRALPAPPAGPNRKPTRVTYRDAKAHGLQLRVSSTGVKTFSVFRRVKGGQPERVTLDKFPTMSVETARKMADRINGSIAEGGNPAAIKRAHKAERTFGELFAEYLERHAKQSKRTWAEDESNYRHYLEAPLGRKRLSAISRATVAAIHASITRAGHPTMANRVLALASSIYGWGISAGLCETTPVPGIKRIPERARDRFLQADELPRFFSSLAEEPNETLRDFFLMALLTGARRANVLAMRWQDINFDRGEWRIRRTKNNEPQTVTLSPEAMEILARRRPSTSEADTGGEEPSEYVFPGPGKAGHLVEPKPGWRRIFDRDELTQLTSALKAAGDDFGPIRGETLSGSLERARKLARKLKVNRAGSRISDLRIHDLRRTLGSWQAKTGASLVIVGKSLNHKSPQTTAIYARLDLDPVRESIQRATSAMYAAAGKKPSADVHQLTRRK